MRQTNSILIVTAILASASIHWGIQTARCEDVPGTAARGAQRQVHLDRTSFYKVPLVCPAAPQIGCGSASKPLLLELEDNNAVSEAWLNRPGTVMAIVWKEQSTPRQRAKVLKAILKERNLTAMDLTGDAKQQAMRDFQSGSDWYRGADVDRLSEEEAGIIANRWIGRFREKISLTDEKAKTLQETFTAQLKRQLTGKTTREETREELLKIARQNLDEKDVAVLLENFGNGFVPKRQE
jgi:hypothetical protein